MDLHSFEVDDLYFENTPDPVVLCLLEKAAESYADGEAEPFLNQAYQLEPENLMVLVALYRFYYYQHRYDDAFAIAQQSLAISARMFGYDGEWRQMNIEILAHGMLQSFGMVRFYLLALKGAGYLKLRLNQIDEGIAFLEKVIELDSSDRIGAKSLLAVANRQKGIYQFPQQMSA